MSSEYERKKFIRDSYKALGIDEKTLQAQISAKPSLLGSRHAVFLFQVNYLPDGSKDIEGRQLVEDAVNKAGFKHLDSCSSRAAYKAKPGKLVNFQSVVRLAANMHHIKIRRILYIPDPGLGLVLNYKEDSV